MSLGATIRRNTAWVLGGNLAGRLLQFAAGILLARLLVPEAFGLVVTVQVFTGAAGFIAAGGLADALVRGKDIAQRDFDVAFTVQLIVCALLYAMFFVLAPWFSVWFDEPRYTMLLRVSALSFLIRPFANIPKAMLKRQMRFRAITTNQLISMAVGTSASIVMAFRGMGPWSLILGGLLGSAFSTLLLYGITRWRPRFALDKQKVKSLGGVGAKFQANAVVEYLRGQTSNFIVSHLMGATQVGLYNKAASQSELPASLVSGSAYQTVFRALASVQDNFDTSRYIYFRTITLVAVYALPIYVLVGFLAEPFIVTVYGEQWRASAAPLQILTLTGLFRVISNPSGAVIAAQGRLGAEFRAQLEAWALLAIGVLIGIRWGLEGVAWGALASYAHLAVRLNGIARRALYARHRDLLRALSPALMLSGMLVALLLVMELLLPAGLREKDWMHLIVVGGTGAAFYALAFLFLPIPALEAEVARWKRRLGLARAGHAAPHPP